MLSLFLGLNVSSCKVGVLPSLLSDACVDTLPVEPRPTNKEAVIVPWCRWLGDDLPILGKGNSIGDWLGGRWGAGRKWRGQRKVMGFQMKLTQV